MQNFAPIGRRSSEITRGKKKKKNKPQQNLSPLPQAIAYGWTNNLRFYVYFGVFLLDVMCQITNNW